ncbi:ABC-type proline/glycine betaine transport system, ATPase components [Hahella chejuensis KCTC 2396]|uniref:ABC-type proline/glycine betaine transport system, ATPase components n=1 Tax=Hahella chejuensis (strain KCTC 2396) TaxID=349521 RepID=Q2SQJ5_HAHCH|nr:ABC transporter ATP-binding protein [Hahella chejuensis]ABC27079.1 ABC-type proline/glycine betaine transport system, ATPase components [Hahella chejuensis KCTC 2396]
MIRLDNVSMQYGEHYAVRNLSLDIASGDFCVLVGTSGCGKSTTLKMINRLAEHSKGRILINNQEIASFEINTLRRRIGYAIQSIGLFPHWNVAKNIAVVPRLLKWEPQRIQNRVNELLELFALDPAIFAEKMPHELSGGQAQRVGVARALAADPDILLMDEPFGALDPITRESLQEEMLRIQSQIKKTIVFVTHDIEEALKLATRIVVMDAGQIVQYDTPENILHRPANPFVENIIGSQDRGLKAASCKQVREIMRPDPPRIQGVAPPCQGAGRLWAVDGANAPVRLLQATVDGDASYRWREIDVTPDMGLQAEDSVKLAISKMLWRKVGALPVLSPDGALLAEVRMADLVGGCA